MEERNLTIIGWEITGKCNLSCPHCYSPTDRNVVDELTVGECKNIIDSIANFKPETIGWTGGEPLLVKDLEELISYAWDKYKIKSGITTNGVLLDKKRVESLKEAGMPSIQISLDGSTPEKSNQVRLTSDEEFYKIIEGIRLSIKSGLKTNLAMLLGAENLDDAPEMIKLAKKEGVKTIRFCGFMPTGRAKNKKIKKRYLAYNRLMELHKFVEAAQADDSIVAMFDPGFGPVPPYYDFHECVAGVQTVYLKANGDVYPCTALLYDEFIIGNLKERSFAEIWNEPAMAAMSGFPRDEIKGFCKSCDNFMHCHGACRSLAYAHTGSFYGSLPGCLYKAWKIHATQSYPG